MITGGAGFIGSNFVKFLLRERPEWQIVNYDLLTYAGNLISLSDVQSLPNYQFIRGDVSDPNAVESAMRGCKVVFHLAAESHVDRSILDAAPFLRTNVLGTQVMLEIAHKLGIEKFIQVSTDEVYGSLEPSDEPFKEDLPLRPNSPYSASKASGDLLARAYFKTFGLQVVVTRCSNNYGPYQFPEKLIPLVIRNALGNLDIPVYGDGQQIRDWIYVEDHCRALLYAYEKGKPGEVYNFGGECEVMNIDLVKTILKLLGKPETLIKYVKDRPGHDRRYAMDITKSRRELNWYPQFAFQQAIEKTVEWYLKNTDWIESVTSGAYREYYQKQYGNR